MKRLLERLLSFAENRSTSGLLSMQPLDAWMGFPHRSFSSIHVAGTNGKGSVSLKIAAALTEAGFRTGLYTSPHLATFRERILVDEVQIGESFIEHFLSTLFPFLDEKKLETSFFTLLTALAFAYFREKNVDYAVIETGLGGRLDATNVITPKLSVITSIARDHCEILGNTLEEIAFEKAGIIKKGVPVVIGPRAHYGPILAAEKKILVPGAEGFYDRENSAIAREALHHLQIPEEAIAKGLMRRPSCRFEVVDPRPVILDVAHNPDGFSRLREALEEFYPGKKFHLVLAMGKKRDPIECVQKIFSSLSGISVISNGHERLYPAEELQKLLWVNGIKAELGGDVKEILCRKEPLLFCGSFYIMELISKEVRALKGD